MNQHGEGRASRQAALLLGLTAFAGLLRMIDLGDKSLWFDEALCYWASQGDLSQVVAMNKSVRAAPPLYTLLVNVWARFGESELWLRLPSWLAGVAAVPLAFSLARRFLPTGAALFSALLVATSVRQVEFSQRVSEYGLAFLVATALPLVFLRFRERPVASRALALSALMLVAPFVHFGLGVLVIALNLAYLVELRRAPRDTRRYAGLAVVVLPLVAAGLLAWFWLDLGQILFRGDAPGSEGYLARSYWDGSLLSLVRLTVGNSFEIFDYAHSMGGLVLLLTGVGVAAGWRGEGAGHWVVLALLIAFAGTFAGALLGVYPYAGKRHVFFLLPLVYAAAGLGLARLSRLEPLGDRRVLVGGIAAVVAVSGVYESGRYLRSELPEHMRPVIAELNAVRGPDDALFIYTPAVPAAHYYLSRENAALRAQLQRRVDEWLPRLRPLRIGPGTAPGGDGDLRFAHCPEDDCDRLPILGNTMGIEIERLDAALAAGGRTWLLLAHCRGDDCERLLTHAAACAEVERVAERANAALYRARSRPGCRPAQAPSLEDRRAGP